MRFVLASSSPRRKELLSNIGIDFTVFPSNKDESAIVSKDYAQTAVYRALAKAEDVSSKLSYKAAVLGADTIVVKNGILGKPQNKKDACRMLNLLGGSCHDVITGLAIVDNSNGKKYTAYEKTTVWMKSLSSDEINRYIATGEPMDKAGSYGIQGLGGMFVERINGSYSNVVGLPIHTLYIVLSEIGYNILQQNNL